MARSERQPWESFWRTLRTWKLRWLEAFTGVGKCPLGQTGTGGNKQRTNLYRSLLLLAFQLTIAFTRCVRREILREPVFLWTMPF